MKKAKKTDSEKPGSKVSFEQPDSNMTSVAIKKYDELIRCTNVLAEGIETEFLKFVTHQEKCREKWHVTEEENHMMKKDMAKYKAETDTLVVKLKHARNQLDSEMRKRLKAEQSVDHMARQLQLIKELLLDKDNTHQLSSVDRQALAQSLNNYSSANNNRHGEVGLMNQSYTFEESGSVLSPSDYDMTDDDILDETGSSMGPHKGKSNKRGRPSAPLLETDEISEDPEYIKRTRVTEEGTLQKYNRRRRFHKVSHVVETHVQLKETSPHKNLHLTDRLDHEFPRPPPQEKRLPSRQHLKESATSSEVTELSDDAKSNSEAAPSFTLSRYRHQQQQQQQKTMIKQNTISNIYPSLDHLTSPKKKFNTISSPRMARKELAHSFVTKIAVKLEACGPCKKKVRFGSSVAKCKECKVVCHLECKDDVPLPCLPSSNTPGSKKQKEGTIEYYLTNKSMKVPPIVQNCIEEIEKRGLKETGLYRIPGAEKDVRELKEKFLRGKTPDLSKYHDVHVICGCLKDFLRGLSEPLVTFGLHESFICAAALSDEDDSLSAMYQCVSELPQANRDTLALVIVHLQHVAQSPQTQMCISNLAKVFGPTIVGHRSQNPTHMEMLEDIKSQPEVVCRLLEMPSDYWNQFIGSNPASKTPPYNPGYFTATPTTPERKPELFSESRLGPYNKENNDPRKFSAMTPKVKSSKDSKRQYFNSPS
ncbi:rac GTPase-activating protein 1 isoform X6 [Hydra vulgaris]|uniref:Rac GTPase-activating protein 1 isoform X6 n=1 Tax=Hydra vulgaris TaxID=6087 RepID=A0ABM4CX98_HYDVU